jgi:uncharacterized membrane protein YccC
MGKKIAKGDVVGSMVICFFAGGLLAYLIRDLSSSGDVVRSFTTELIGGLIGLIIGSPIMIHFIKKSHDKE